jgi:hypothetical protein
MKLERWRLERLADDSYALQLQLNDAYGRGDFSVEDAVRLMCRLGEIQRDIVRHMLALDIEAASRTS